MKGCQPIWKLMVCYMKIRMDLETCLSNEGELATKKWKRGYEDEWPVERAYAL